MASNTPAMLSTDAVDLERIVNSALNGDGGGAKYVAFSEPDLGGDITAVVLAPEGRLLVRGLRLALQERKTTSGGDDVAA